MTTSDLLKRQMQLAPLQWAKAREHIDSHARERVQWVLTLRNREDPRCVNICDWLKSNAEPGLKWLKDLFDIANQFTIASQSHAWQMAPAKQRRRHAEKVARLARELAHAMQSEPCPSYPSPWALLAKDELWEIFATLLQPIPPSTPGLASIGSPRDPTDDQVERLYAVFFPPYPPQLPPMLNRLADFADELASNPGRKRNYDTKNTPPEVFALEDRLFDYLSKRFGEVPAGWHAFVADCVEVWWGKDVRDPEAVRVRQARRSKPQE